MSLILDEEKLTLAKWNVPRQVQTLLNYKSTNRSVYIGLIGGGVEINPRRTLERAKFQAPPDTQLGQTYKASLKPSPAGESPAAASPPQVPSAKKVKGAAAPTAAPRSTTETIRWWWD